MSDIYFLNLKDKTRVIDFLLDHLVYADEKQRDVAQKLITSYQEGEHLSTDKLADSARKFAIAIWPARYALREYFLQHGDEEWQSIMASVRPSTAHLLERVRRATKTKNLDEVIEHAESEVALKEGERIEIKEVRTHLWLDEWKKRGAEMKEGCARGEAGLKKYLGKLKSLRDLAIDLSGSLQDEVFSKIAHYEDRIFFKGEEVELDVLEREVAYYTEQKEISPTD